MAGRDNKSLTDRKPIDTKLKSLRKLGKVATVFASLILLAGCDGGIDNNTQNQAGANQTLPIEKSNTPNNTNNDDQNTQNSSELLLQAMYGHFGVDGYAKCVSSLISVKAMILKGANIPITSQQTDDNLLYIFGQERQYMLAHDVSQEYMDMMLKKWNPEMYDGDYAYNVFMQCSNEMGEIANSSTTP